VTTSECGTAQCSKCQTVKDFGAFHSKGQRRDSRCKTCVSKAKAKAYARKKAQAKASRTRRKNYGYTFSSNIIGSPSVSVIDKAATILGGAMKEIFDGDNK
jgi:hypothetical protein